MKTKISVNRHVLMGMVSILVGVLIYFFLPDYAFTSYGIPMSTSVLVLAGLASIHIGLRVK